MTAPAWWDVETACAVGTLLMVLGTLGVARVVVWLAELAARRARRREARRG